MLRVKRCVEILHKARFPQGGIGVLPQLDDVINRAVRKARTRSERRFRVYRLRTERT